MKQLFASVKANLSLIIVPLIFIGFAFFAKVYVLSDHKNAVTHYGEIAHPGYESSPEQYIVNPSPAKAWELTHLSPAGRTMDAIAVVLFWVAIILLILGASDLLPLKPLQLIIAVMLLLFAWGGCKYGSYSSAVSNTQVILSPGDYEKANASPNGLDNLFNGKKPL